MWTGGTPTSGPLTRVATGLIYIGLAGYALAAPVSITAATIALLIAVAGAVPLWLRRTPAPYVSMVLAAVGLFLLLKLITVLTAVDVSRSLRAYTKLWPYLVFAVVPLSIHRGPRAGLLLRLLAVSVSVVSAYAIVQHFTGWEFWRGYDLSNLTDRYAAVGLFDNQQTWSGVALVGTLFFGTLAAYRSRDRWLFAATGLLALGGTIASMIRGPLVGIAGGVGVLLLISGRRARWAALALAALTLVAALSSGAMMFRLANIKARALNPDVDVSRIHIWETAWSIGLERPLVGVGPGNFREAYGVHVRIEGARILNHAHSEWFNEWATSGALGVLGFSAMLGAVGLALWRRRRAPTGIPAASLVAWTGLACAALFQCHFTDEEVLMAAVFTAALGLLPGPGAADDNKEVRTA